MTRASRIEAAARAVLDRWYCSNDTDASRQPLFVLMPILKAALALPAEQPEQAAAPEGEAGEYIQLHPAAILEWLDEQHTKNGFRYTAHGQAAALIRSQAAEIERLIRERDHYRALVEKRLGMPLGYLADLSEQNSVYTERDRLAAQLIEANKQWNEDQETIAGLRARCRELALRIYEFQELGAWDVKRMALPELDNGGGR